jgi:hypothetical protein
MDKKISNGAEYIAQFPLILYCSVKLVKEKTLEQLLEIVRRIEERRDWRERPMINENGFNITDRLEYEEFRELTAVNS